MDANLLIQHAFPREQYPIEKLTDNTGYLLLLRAFQWVHQPHSLASLMQNVSERWVQLFDLLLTRPSNDPDPVDTSVKACASRLLELHPDNRSILDLYPAFAKDPALLSEYLLSVGAYDANNTLVCYGLKLTIAASCLVAHLQDEFGSIIVDQYLSQPDLLFILSAGGVYTGSLGSARSFVSELFPVYASANDFLTLYPQMLNMDYSVLILPPPKSMTENVSLVKWTAYNQKLFTARTRQMYRQRRMEAFHRPPEFRTSFVIHQSEFHIEHFHHD